MFGLSIWHLLILLVVVLIFGGSRRLPEMGSSLGKGVRNFKRGLEGIDEAPKNKHDEKLEDQSENKA